MSLLTDSLVTARQLGRYRSLQGAQWISRGRWIALLQGPLLRFGLPMLAPFAASRVGPESTSVGVLFGLVVLFAMAYFGARPALDRFTLLAHPSREGLVLGTLLHRVGWLAWCGLCASLTYWMVAPGTTDSLGGRLFLVGVLLTPLVCALRGGARRIAERSGNDRADGLGAAASIWFVFWLVTEGAGRFGAESPQLIGLGAALLHLVYLELVFRRAPLGVTRSVSYFTMLAVLLLSATRFSDPLEAAVAWLGGPLLATALGLLCLELRAQLRQVGGVQLYGARIRSGVESKDDSLAEAQSAESTPGVDPEAARLDQRAAGIGFVEAIARYRRLGRDELASYGKVLYALIACRGPILAALAVWLSSADSTMVSLALLAAFIAARPGAVDSIELDEQLWLFGVDYRDQVRHGLRSLLLWAALPSLGAALLTLVVTGAGDIGRQLAVLALGGAFLFRAGLPGVWPLKETDWMRLVFVSAVLLVGSWLYVDGGSVPRVGWASVVLVGVGLAMVAARLWRLQEPRLRACVRVANEP